MGPKDLNWDSKIKFDGYRKSILNAKGISEFEKTSTNKKFAWRSYYQYIILWLVLLESKKQQQILFYH